MIEMAFGFDDAVADFVQRHIEGCQPFGNVRAIGFVNDGVLIGGTVFHNYNPEAGVIELTTAATSPRWLTRTTLHAIFAYPFERCGCQMLYLRVKAGNERMVRIARRYGFNEHRIPRMWGRDEDGFIFTLTDDQWRETSFERHRK